MNHSKHRVAIVGAGISGLAAAHQLSRSDVSLEINVFEANDRLGGVLQTEQTDGFCIELGPDSVLSRMPWAVNLFRDVGLSDQLINTNPLHHGVDVVCRGRLERLPDGLAVMAPQRIWPMVTTPILSWRGKVRLAAERLIPRRHASDDESLAAFACRRLGREAFQRLVQPLAGGIYMGDPEQLSINATFPQFVEMESKYGSLIKAARAGAKTQRAAAPGAKPPNPAAGGPEYSLFVAPQRGLGSAIDALASGLGRCNICTNHQVLSLARSDNGWAMQIKQTESGETRREEYAAVILAVPAHHAASVLQTTDQELAKALNEIPYAGCVVVNLAYDRDAFPGELDNFGFLVPHVEQRPVLACTFSSVKYAGRAPDGKVLLRAFLGGACREEVMQWSDETMVQTVQNELRQLMQVSKPPLFSRIKRWHRAMPQCVLGHAQRVKGIEQLAAKHPRLELAGNAYHGVGIPHCIRSGQQAAERVLAGLNT
ncbi:protoporphyrinogen oxidase [Stieleria sp. ICT_E10.1]|uniref:protoporphyrinogen oxidase n=1 Tax=Stieleria sedimenti TaxID=2976331 RepID=UPI0021802951|nr:protoporphyrinogen oxidase [Stieleria sedimenti]MCS7468661.1 protoporphyrinogen oxidase [Stieleria sedimenti]